MSDFTKALIQLRGKQVFLKTDPEILDFTNSGQKKNLIIQCENATITIPLPFRSEELARAIAPLTGCIGEDANIIIGWNIKSFFSYCLNITGKHHRYEQIIWDLKIIESFLGKSELPPKTATEATLRLKKCVANSSWKKFNRVYSEVYYPLIIDVVPSMETEGLAHRGDIFDRVYSYYELEGQINGRSKTLKVLKKSFMPHSLSPKDKKFLYPIDDDRFFMQFDFCNMEVSVLQWLSNDPVLGKILKGKKDVYEQIWYKSTGLNDEDARNKAKSTFLPVVYGLGAKGLAKRLEMREDLSAWIIDKYYKTFPKAFQWIRQQSINEEGWAIDYFGRKRKFEDGSLYKSRNFLVQAPANIICLKKLVNLWNSTKNFAKLAFHVHDGFCILVRSTEWKKVFLLGKEALESEDDLFPGLFLKTACEAGTNLNKLSSISKN